MKSKLFKGYSNESLTPNKNKYLIGNGGPETKKINPKKQKKDIIEKKFKEIIQQAIDRYKELIKITKDTFIVTILNKTYAFPLNNGIVTYLLAKFNIIQDTISIIEINTCQDLFLYYLKHSDEKHVSNCPDVKTCSCSKLKQTHRPIFNKENQPCILCLEGSCSRKVNCLNNYLLLPDSSRIYEFERIPDSSRIYEFERIPDSSRIPESIISGEEEYHPDLEKPESYVVSDLYKQALLKESDIPTLVTPITPVKPITPSRRQKTFNLKKKLKEIKNKKKIMCKQWLSNNTCGHEKCDYVCKKDTQTYCDEIIKKVETLLLNKQLPIDELSIKMLEQLQNKYGKEIVEIIWTNSERNKELKIPSSYKTENMKKAYDALMDNTINISEHMVGIINLWCIIYNKSKKQRRYMRIHQDNPIIVDTSKTDVFNMKIQDLQKENPYLEEASEQVVLDKVGPWRELAKVKLEKIMGEDAFVKLQKEKAQIQREKERLQLEEYMKQFEKDDEDEIIDTIDTIPEDDFILVERDKYIHFNFSLEKSGLIIGSELPKDFDKIACEFNRRTMKCYIYQYFYLRDKYMLIEGDYNINCIDKASIPYKSICTGGNCCLRGLHEGNILSLDKYTNNYSKSSQMIEFEKRQYSDKTKKLTKLKDEYIKLMQNQYMQKYCEYKNNKFQSDKEKHDLKIELDKLDKIKDKIQLEINSLYDELLKLEDINVDYICDGKYDKYTILPFTPINLTEPVYTSVTEPDIKSVKRTSGKGKDSNVTSVPVHRRKKTNIEPIKQSEAEIKRLAKIEEIKKKIEKQKKEEKEKAFKKMFDMPTSSEDEYENVDVRYDDFGNLIE